MSDDNLSFGRNPGERLYLILKAASGYDQAADKSTMWADVLDARSTDPLDLLPLYYEACALPDRVEEALASAGIEDAELFTRYMDPVRQLLDRESFRGKWQGSAHLVNPTVLYSIEHTARELAKYPCEKEVEYSTLEELRDRIWELYRKAEGDGSLDPDIREFVHRHLISLLDGISMYRIKGADGFRECTYAAVGEVLIKSDVIKGDATRKSYTKDVLEIVRTIHEIADKAQDVALIAAPTVPYIADIVAKLA